MQIPYEVQERPDTGLYNAKLGIWLFLASEVMLFGGLFSAYIFLRLGAPDGTWPDHVLWYLPGLINTGVLILSSVTVVLSWLYVKIGDFKMFRICMIVTLICSVLFMGIKSFEYNGKFHHFGAFMKDDARPNGYSEQITGHLIEETDTYFLVAADTRQPSDWISSRAPKVEKDSSGDELAKIGDDPHQGPSFQHPGIIATGKMKPVKTIEGKVKAALGEDHAEHPVFKVMKDQVFRSSMFTPAYNSYFSIYFTMTGLHALHVIGGALVLAYFCFPGSKMFFTDRQHFANRIEVAGLFWHFVDLVWIFLFPILYLL
ncbi:MAG: heme-copper oxidase subunit III [Candidatus Methylacidiphilales bacterium]